MANAPTEKDDTRYYDEVFQRLRNQLTNGDNVDQELENENGNLNLKSN
jgi:hypothetical protein